MHYRIGLVGMAAAVGLFTATETFPCGDKFLVAGRGTRYQRPKTARAASILIYANASSGLLAALGKLPVEAVLKREGHRPTTIETPDQLSAILAGGRFDVILAASGVVSAVEELLGRAADAPVVVALCRPAESRQARDERVPCAVKGPAKPRALLEAIDRAVIRRDQKLRRAEARG